MPKRIKFEGKVYVVPDDASDDEINQIVGGGPAPTQASVQAAAPQRGLWDRIVNSGNEGGMPQEAGLRRQPNSVVTGAGKGLTSLLGGVSHVLGGPGATPVETQPSGVGEHAGNLIERMAEMEATGGPIKGLLGKAAPIVGRYAAPLLRIGGEAANTALNAKAHGEEAGPAALAGGAGAALGEAGAAVAPKMVENALNIRGAAKRFGQTPGRAILDETSGIRPVTIARQAGQKASSLTSDLENRTAAASVANPTGASTAPAIQTLDSAIGKYQARNAAPVVSRLQDVKGQLTTDLATGNPLGPDVSPRKILDLKRGINDTMGSWTRENKKGVQSVLPSVYHSLDSELDRTVPGASGINQRISSLIPASSAARKTAEGGRSLGYTLAKHTLVPAVGASVGYGMGGDRNSALAGSLGAEALMSPTARIGAARLLRGAVPIQLGRAASTLSPDEEDERRKKR